MDLGRQSRAGSAICFAALIVPKFAPVLPRSIS
jgi:hypothetical protein